ncbi:TetR/AcrR family transcriptional regulator [Natrarchaeobius sp. A-rgal3]|uniref:TetR/AcrR family transcriptional regulator n=1 Tax=Natrarchaeobius versutus TaxID=1679078 RepID=UPI00350F48D2
MDVDRGTKPEILDAAYCVLVDAGYAEFTTQAVADAAGVSQSLVHYYFDTKQGLVCELWRYGLDQLTDKVERRAEADDPRDWVLET